MKGKRKILAIIITAFALTVFLFLWNKPSVSIEIVTWNAPKPFSTPINLIICDLDGDSNEEIVIDSSWHLQLKGKRWKVERLPLGQGEKLVMRPIKRFLLVKTAKNELLLLQKRGRWQKRKLAENLTDVWTLRDWRDNGEDDDLLILSRASVLLWFKVKSNGTISLQDVLKLPKFNTIHQSQSSIHIRTSSAEVTVFPWHRKLHWTKGYWECDWADLDGDKKPDLVMVGKEQVSALLTSRATKSPNKPETIGSPNVVLQKLTHLPLVSIHLPVSLLGLGYGIFDLDGDGLNEVIGTDERGYVHRLWLENFRWRREETPFAVKGAPFAILKVGEQNWLLFAPREFPCPKAILTAIWRSESGWRRKVWQLWNGGESSLVFWLNWDDKKLRIWLSKKPFPAILVKHMDEWLSQAVIDLPLLPFQTKMTQTHVWHWDERKRTWKLAEVWEGYAKFADLNMDGREERVLLNENARWIKLAVYGGRFWKRWWTVTLIRKPYAKVTTLRQRDRTWVVAIEADCKKVHAWTLRK